MSRNPGAKRTLSARQAEIAQLVRAGKSSREIGEILFIDARTVDTHVAAICNKLGMRTRLDMVLALFGTTSVDPPVEVVGRGNIALRPGSLIGRENIIAEVVRRLGQDRLITLVGPGGVGKTRVALQVAAEVHHRYADGAWLVDFAVPDRVVSVAHVVASTLRLGDLGRLPAEEAVALALGRRELLLILDNCEHVVTQAAALSALLLRRCTGISILATSLEALKIGGQVLTDVLPLVLPIKPNLQNAKKCSAVQLFEH